MLDKQALAEFRDAAWKTREDLRGFVERVGAVEPAGIRRLLAVLLEPKLVAQGAQHRNRCSAFGVIARASLSPELFGPFATALPEGDVSVRKVLVALLPRVNEVGGHEILCQHLGSRDELLRASAAEALAQVAGPSALAHLTRMVHGRAFAGRSEAMRVMIPRARHRAIPLLAAVLQAGTPNERLEAIGYLLDPEVARDHDAAVAAVRAAFEDGDRRVSTAAFKAFGRLVSEDVFFDEMEDRLYGPEVDPALIQSLGAYPSIRSLAVLDHRVRVGPNAVRQAAVEALSEIATDDTVPIFVAAVHVPDITVRRKAAEALSELSQQGSLDLALVIVELLRSKVDDVRRIGAHLARSVEDPRGDLAARLLRFLRDRDWWVRERVMDALVEMMGESLTPHLVEYLGDESPVIRRFAIGGLIRTRDPGALGAILRSAGEDPDWWVREQAVLSTAEIGDRRAIPYLEKLARERPDLRLASIDALKKLGAQDELLGLAELAGDEDRNVRMAVIRYLKELPRAREAEFYVRSCMDDPDSEVMREARELLASWEVTPDSEAAVAALGVLDRLLASAVREKADDVILAAGRPPCIKSLNEVRPISRGVIRQEELEGMLQQIMTGAQREALANGHDVDFSYEVKAYALRFRVNVLRQYTGLAAVFRNIKQQLPDIDQLGLPPIIKAFGDYANGLVLVGGPTGSGKSTTLAALIDYINRSSSRHIVTVEDPIEVVHPQRRSLINQREVGTHTPHFHSAMRSTLRQDPDVILVGELRDLETIDFAVNAAETGHLVFGTVHTASADTSIDRIVHTFPSAQQALARAMLAESLRAVVCQQLVRRVDRPDARVLAVEVMVNNDAISNLIRKNKSFQIPSVISTHREQGMQLLDEQLERLVRAGIVAADEALMRAVDKASFASMLVTAGYLEVDDGPAVGGPVRVSMAPARPTHAAPPEIAVASPVPPAPDPEQGAATGARVRVPEPPPAAVSARPPGRPSFPEIAAVRTPPPPTPSAAPPRPQPSFHPPGTASSLRPPARPPSDDGSPRRTPLRRPDPRAVEPIPLPPADAEEEG